MHLIKKALLLLATLLLASASYGQTCSIPGQAGTANLAAQPNSFFPGTGSPGAGASSLAVGAGTGVNASIQAGDLLLIIQMQGADINSTNTNSYGDGTPNAGFTSTVAFGVAGYAGGISGANFVAGTYEWAVATGGGSTFAAGGTVNLSRGLSNSYFTRAGSSTTGKQAFQVVRVPQYANATLTAGLTVQAWNGSTGGVLAIDAAGDINLNGQTINGNGRGFRGGGAIVVNPQCTTTPDPIGCPEYRSLISTELGGSKGEGLVGTPGRVYNGDPNGTGVGAVGAGADGYINGDLSRGAPGNAGGGGNQHNGGGGGGGNGGVGGNGGNSWNASQAGYVGTRVGGFGGSTSQNAAARWLMGGGGGSADIGGNGYTSPDGSGGAGGAMVVLRASRVLSGGATININGARGLDSRATDGGGGGGSGGTLIVAAGVGGVSGALTVNANGGQGGAYQPVGLEQDGTGGGGGGGVLITNAAGITFNANGGAAGISASTVCPPAVPAADCGQRAGIATAGTSGYAIVSPGVQVGYECLPNLAVTKLTSTPVVTSSSSATASYSIAVVNTGGGARFVNLQDLALPPGWTLAGAPNYAYSPVQPLAAGRLSSGAETIAITTSSTWAVGATPLSVPATGSNTLTWSSFAVAPINNGTPGAVTVNFVVNIPDTAAVGTYHNGAGVSFLDSTRAAASTRTVAPLTGVTANRSSTAYGPTTYANYAGAATTNVLGSHYSALQGGPTGEDVRLIPNLSILKTAPATATPGTTFSYTITPRNSGRGIGSQTYAVSQATSVTTANVPLVLGSSPVTVTDTLPSGVTLSTSLSGTGWTCTGASVVVCTLANANAYPVAAATNFASITATATMTASCTPLPLPQTNTVVISAAAGETVTADNTATAVTTATCVSANVSITKSDAVTTVTAGSITSYTVTVANAGPGSASGSVLTDTASPGLVCNAVTCTGTTGGAVCPVVGAGPGQLSIANLLSPGSGVVLASLPATSSISFAISCSVTASGLP